MQELKKLQIAFLKAFVNPNDNEDFVRHVETDAPLTSQQRVDIYRNSIREGMTNALGNTFPVCKKLVGDDFFRGLCVYFIKDIPSISPNLNDYGNKMPEFIADFEPAKSLPYLPDVARLEWAWHCVSCRPSEPQFDFNVLSAMPEEQREQLVLQLPQNSALIYSIYPIHRIWEVNQEEYKGDQTVSLDEGEARLLVWRDAKKQMRIDVLTDSQWQLAQAMDQQKTLGAICETLMEENFDVLQLLQAFASRGWIAGMRY